MIPIDLEGHVQKFNDQLCITFDSSNIPYNPFFKSARVAFDHFGNKWMSTSHGLAMYNDLSWSFYDSSNSPFPNEIIYTGTIYIDSRNNKFIETNGKGLLIFNENGIDVSTNELETSEKDIL